MRRLFATMVLLLLAGACVSVDRVDCPAPRLVPSDLIAGDAVRDRGFYGGVSLADVDGDGDLDLMATGGYSPVARPRQYRANALYLNDGSGNFSYSEQLAFTADNPHSGSTWADIDADGDLDAFVAIQHGRPDIFYRNLGGGVLVREDLGDATATPGSNFSASWVDIDGDDDLDLTVGGPTLERASQLLIYRNDEGRFTRVTGTPLENGVSNAGALLWADFDNDGDPDMFVANSDIMRRSNLQPAEYEASQLYRNDGDWAFARVEGQAFSDSAFAALGAAAGDIDGDGDLDLLIQHFRGRDQIFLNDGVGRFSRDERFVGPDHAGISTAASFADVDGDGDLDLVSLAYGEGIGLWLNDGSGQYARTSDPMLAGHVRHFWAAGSGDLDADGDIDFVLGSWGETEDGEFMTLLRNESAPCGRTLRVELRSAHGALDPIGARVTLVTRGDQGERHQVREAMGQSSMRSQSGSTFLFSVPRGERVLHLQVRWPNGRTRIVRGARNGAVIRE